MSYDVQLCEPGTDEPIQLAEPHDLRGGTYAIGGTTEAWLNVTYNYGVHFYRVLGEKGIRTLYGMTGEESLPVIREAIAQLDDDVDDDYWKPTEGNARKALENLEKLATLAPHGVWQGD